MRLPKELEQKLLRAYKKAHEYAQAGNAVEVWVVCGDSGAADVQYLLNDDSRVPDDDSTIFLRLSPGGVVRRRVIYADAANPGYKASAEEYLGLWLSEQEEAEALHKTRLSDVCNEERL